MHVLLFMRLGGGEDYCKIVSQHFHSHPACTTRAACALVCVHDAHFNT